MFTVESTYDNFYQVKIIDSKCFHLMSGSYSVFAARILGLTYPNYIRLCVEKFGALIRGQAPYYSIIFKSEENAKQLKKYLNDILDFHN